MTKKQSKPVCETTGVNAKMLRSAVKCWEKERRKAGLSLEPIRPKSRLLAATLSVSYVASLPPPPAYGTPEYTRCIQFWYQCYMQASYLDNYRNQMAQIQQQITNGEINLTGYLSGYANCIGGFPV